MPTEEWSYNPTEKDLQLAREVLTNRIDPELSDFDLIVRATAQGFAKVREECLETVASVFEKRTETLSPSIELLEELRNEIRLETQ